MTPKQVCDLAIQFEDVSVKNHFGSDGFSAHKRMFLTVWHDENKANLRLSPEEQKRFLSIDGQAFIQIDNAWGRQGWTSVNLKYVDKGDMKKALEAAWEYSKTRTPKSNSEKKTPKKKVTRKKS